MMNISLSTNRILAVNPGRKGRHQDVSTVDRARFAKNGFSLIELMVGIAISLIGIVIIFQVFSVSEQRKRVISGSSDAVQNGSYVGYYLQRAVAVAGGGFASIPNACGAPINMMRNGLNLFPNPDAGMHPVPYDTLLNFSMVYSPALIVPGGSATVPDSLIILSGNSSGLSTYVPLKNQPAGGQIDLQTNIGLFNNDLLLGVEQTPPYVIYIAQATSVTVPPAVVDKVTLNAALATAPSYHHSTGFDALTASTFVTDLGPPSNLAFQALTIANDPSTAAPNSLLSYDMISGTTPITVADNIFNLKFLYGIDDGTGTLKWQQPTGDFSVANLTDASALARSRIGQIKAIRISVVAQNGQPEKLVNGVSPITPGPLVMFQDDNANKVSVTLTSAQKNFRYQIYEVVVPLRNMLIQNDQCAG